MVKSKKYLPLDSYSRYASSYTHINYANSKPKQMPIINNWLGPPRGRWLKANMVVKHRTVDIKRESQSQPQIEGDKS